MCVEGKQDSRRRNGLSVAFYHTKVKYRIRLTSVQNITLKQTPPSRSRLTVDVGAPGLFIYLFYLTEGHRSEPAPGLNTEQTRRGGLEP